MLSIKSPELISLKQQTFITSQCVQESGQDLSVCVLWFRVSHRPQSRCQLDLQTSKAQLGRSAPSSRLWLLTSLISSGGVGLRASGSHWPEASLNSLPDLSLHWAAHNMAAGFIEQTSEKAREGKQDRSWSFLVTISEVTAHHFCLFYMLEIRH